MMVTRKDAIMKNFIASHIMTPRGVASVLAILLSAQVFAQNARIVGSPLQADTLRCEIYFRQGRSAVDGSFSGNDARIDHLISATDGRSIRSARIIASSSLEGSTTFNLTISEQRAKAAANTLSAELGLSESEIELVPIGEGWDILRSSVYSSDMKYRQFVLGILDYTPIWIKRDGIIVDGRKKQLKDLKGAVAWKYMQEEFFPLMRVARIELVCESVFEQSAVEESDEEPAYLPEKEIADTAAARIEPLPLPHPEEIKPEKKPFYMSLRSNLVYSLALVPNIGIDFSLGNGWAISGSYVGAWWNKGDYYWRIYGGEIDLSKYFGRAAARKPLSGHHIGAYAQVFTYDFELGARGFLSDLSYGAGLAYGYTFPLGKRLNLDCSVGFGYLGGDYKIYDPEDGHYVWKETRRRFWLGPTKAEIAFVWLLGRGNYNSKQKK